MTESLATLSSLFELTLPYLVQTIQSNEYECSSFLFGFLKELPVDNMSLYLSRAIVNLKNFGITKQFFYRVVSVKTITSKYLEKIKTTHYQW
jgi:hypothetical protein